MILAIKTDAPTTELIVTGDDGVVIVRQQWLAERRLAQELLTKLETVLDEAHGSWDQLSGLIVFKGPGSFTGLRIGITVMNTVAYSQQIPIVGQTGDAWLADGVQRIRDGHNDRMIVPEYGAPAKITQPRK